MCLKLKNTINSSTEHPGKPILIRVEGPDSFMCKYLYLLMVADFFDGQQPITFKECYFK